MLAQTDFEQVERNQREGRWDLVGELLAEQGNKLKAAGADFFLLACHTVDTADERIETAASRSAWPPTGCTSCDRASKGLAVKA